jgi:hypothetical protein
VRGELFGMQGRGASCLGCKDEGRAVWDARTRGELFGMQGRGASCLSEGRWYSLMACRLLKGVKSCSQEPRVTMRNE